MTLKSARGHSYRAVELALQLLATKRFPLDLITTHRFGLDEVDYAIKSVGGQGAPGAIHVSVMPWRHDAAEFQQLVDAIRMLTQAELIDYSGHGSARRDAGSFYINSGASVRSSLTTDDIVAIDFDGVLQEGQARSRRWSSRCTPRSTARAPTSAP